MNTCPDCGYIDPEWCSRCGMTGTHTQACAYMKTPPERGHRSTNWWHRPATDQNTTRPPKKGGHFQQQNENDNHVIRGGGQTMLDLDGTGE